MKIKYMKQIMANLLENLNLCMETYLTVYLSVKNKIINTATLASNKKFDFIVILTDYNIPHLLGFLLARELSISAIKFLNSITKGYKLTNKSTAMDVLLKIYENQNEILATNGLYEENGKFYEILNWQKIILKMASFIRGDFFKTCFCLAQIAPDK